MLVAGSLAAAACLNALAGFPGSAATDVHVSQLPQSAIWQKLGGPQGGLGYDVRMRPDDPDVMYVTDAWSGVNMSTDGGRTWQASNAGIETRVGPSGDAVPVFSLTIDPHDPDTIWAGTQDTRGIYKSADGGLTWTRKDNGIAENEGISFRGFTVDPVDADVVYAAAEIASFVWAGRSVLGREFDLTQGVVYRTIDGGDSWEAIWRGDNLARYIWIDPRDTDVIYISTGIFDREAANSDPATGTPGGEGILKTTDGGATWFRVNNGLNNLYIGSLFMHPENPDILLAGAGNNAYPSGGGIYLSADGGSHWKRVGGEHITSVEFTEVNPDVAYASGADAFYRSSDGGHTWQSFSRPGGWGWGPVGIRPGFPIDFQVDPRDPDRIFVNNYSGGNFLSENGGKTWETASKGYTGAQLHDIAVAPDDSRLVYAIGRSGPFRSLNGGEDWQGLAFPPAGFAEWNAVAINPEDPWEVLISDEFEGSLLRSTDAGSTWTLVFQHPQAGGDGVTDRHGFKAIEYAPSNPRIVYAGMRKGRRSVDGDFPAEPSFGVYRSTDGGTTWQERNDTHTAGLNINALVIDSLDPDTVYVTTYRDGIFKTTDGGETWQPVNSGLQDLDIRAIAIDPENPDTLYAGVENGGVYRSDDRAAHWRRCGSGMDPQANVRAIVVDPTNPTIVYAADLRTGVYRSTDRGDSFVRITDGLATRAVTAMAISSDGEVLYAATEGEGAFRLGKPPPGVAPAPSPVTATQPTTPTPDEPEEVDTAPLLMGPALPVVETDVAYSQDFEGSSHEWNLEKGWEVTTVDGDTVLEGTGHRWARLHGLTWDDYVVATRFKLLRGEVHVNYRCTDKTGGLHRYFIGLSAEAVGLSKQVGDQFFHLGELPLDLSEGWHEIEIRGQGDILNVFLDGTLLIACQDEDAVLEGGIAFETLEDSLCLIDDVEIRQAPETNLAADTQAVAAPTSTVGSDVPAPDGGEGFGWATLLVIGSAAVLVGLAGWVLWRRRVQHKEKE